MTKTHLLALSGGEWPKPNYVKIIEDGDFAKTLKALEANGQQLTAADVTGRHKERADSMFDVVTIREGALAPLVAHLGAKGVKIEPQHFVRSSPNGFGCPLSNAISTAQYPAMEELIDQNGIARLTKKNLFDQELIRDNTLFYSAALHNGAMHAVVQAIEAQGEKVTKADFKSRYKADYNNSYLHLAAQSGQLNVVNDALKRNGDGEMLTREDVLLAGRDDTPLHDAARQEGSLKVLVDTLASNGEKLSKADFMTVTTDHQRETVIHKAAYFGQLTEVARALALNGEKLTGEDLMVADKHGGTALALATHKEGGLANAMEAVRMGGGNLTKDQLLDEKVAGMTIHKKELQTLVDGVNANGEQISRADWQKPHDKRTLIAYAAENDQLSAVFTPANWAGHEVEMMRTWSEDVPEWKRKSPGFDINDRLGQAMAQREEMSRRATDHSERVRLEASVTAAPTDPNRGKGTQRTTADGTIIN